MQTNTGVRQSIYTLQRQYENGDKQPLEDLMRAWKAIKELPPEDPRSFFTLGGYHGEPFQYRTAVDALDATDTYLYWGGYCNHGNVLFPTWHRVYVLKVEQALQSIVPGVMLPYWDESDTYTLANGIPSILTQDKFMLDGVLIDNPLRSFVLPTALTDAAAGDQNAWAKPKGYQTVRYPLSGLVGTPEARAATEVHNALFPDKEKNTALLNRNVRAWLHGAGPTGEGPTVKDPNPSTNGVYAKLIECLNAPNYTVFSNTTSAADWNMIMPGKVTSLESPHNSIHLAVGGFDWQGDESGQVAGANGDMGENNTAGLDPIFFFHHCNVDRMFWVWQKLHGKQDELEILHQFAGTSASDAQGPTPGVAPGTELDLDTALLPFTKSDGTHYTSRDCVNIEKQLGFTYAPGSLDPDSAEPRILVAEASRSARKLHVRGISRTAIQGSFVLTAYATLPGADGQPERRHLGHTAVLSRYNVVRCANCLTHVDVMAHFPLHPLTAAEQQRARYHVELVTHEGVVELTPGMDVRARFARTAVKPGKRVEMQVID